jgi:hypothetical protein
VLVSLADFKILEIEAATLVPLDRFHHRSPPNSLPSVRLRTQFTIRLP